MRGCARRTRWSAWSSNCWNRCAWNRWRPQALQGVAHNLRHRFEQWSLAFHRSRLTDSARGILLYTVAQVCRARVTGEPVLEETEDLMEATRAALAPAMGSDLAGLRRQRHDQAAYAVHALGIARLVGEMLRSADDEDDDRADSVDAEDSERAAFGLVMELDARVEEGVAAAVSGHSRVFEAAQQQYRIYTTAYDREVPATALARAEVLQEHRVQLDRLVAASGLNLARLARELKALLARPVHDGWDSAMEEGRIDGRRLAQLIASPTERRLFRSEHVDAAGRLRAGLPDRLLRLDEAAHRAAWPCWWTCSRARWNRRAWPAKCWASPPARGTAGARGATGSAPASRRSPAGSTSSATWCSRMPTRAGAARGRAWPRC